MVGRDLTADQERQLLLWEVAGCVWIMAASSLLHFVHELSGFNTVAAAFGSVNESTWEHLKLFFWPGLVFALVQYRWVKSYAKNYWLAKAAGLITTPIVVVASFYLYLAVAIPVFSGGNIVFDIGTGALGVFVGGAVSYRILIGESRPCRFEPTLPVLAIVGLAAAFVLLTYFPIRIFLFEDFRGYESRGQYGILDDPGEQGMAVPSDWSTSVLEPGSFGKRL